MTKYRPRIYGSQRLGREGISLRKDADESVVPLNDSPEAAVEGGIVKEKFEVELDPLNLVPLKVVIERYIQTVLALKNANKAKTAEALGIGRTTIYRKLGLRKD